MWKQFGDNSPPEFLFCAELLLAALDFALDGLAERVHVLVALQPPRGHGLPANVAHHLLRAPVALRADSESIGRGFARWPNRMLSLEVGIKAWQGRAGSG